MATVSYGAKLQAQSSKERRGLMRETYDGGNGELVLAGVLEQGQDVIADDDTGLAAQNIGSTHFCEVGR